MYALPGCFHSISFPSEWGPTSATERRRREREEANSFHSISFPSEWGRRSKRKLQRARRVSIQLVSPASGDSRSTQAKGEGIARFHSISFPSEWGRGTKVQMIATNDFLNQFPFN